MVREDLRKVKRRSTLVVLVLVLGATVGSCHQSSDRFLTVNASSDELYGSLQGPWIVISSTGLPGGGAAFDDLIDHVVVFSNRRLQGDPEWYRGKDVVIGVAGNPRHIDLIQSQGAKGWNRIGVFYIDGDRLYVLLGFDSENRPVDFDNRTESQELVILERHRAGS